MRMLAVDGGGVRGIVPLVWLMRLEAVTGKRVQELFDAFIGTSIGAAIVCGLSLGHRPDDLLAMLQEGAPLIFPRGWPWVRNRLARVATEGFSAPRYDARPLYDFMGKLYGDRTFSAVEIPTIVTSYDITRRQLRVLRSWNLTDREHTIRDLCMASAAAPGYFPAYPLVRDGRTFYQVDGGVAVNSPSALGWSYLRRDLGATPGPVTSMGTGHAVSDLTHTATWGLLQWAPHIFDVFGDGQQDAVNAIGYYQFAPYYWRFQCPLVTASPRLDNTHPANLRALEFDARHYITNEGALKLDQAAMGLLSYGAAPPVTVREDTP